MKVIVVGCGPAGLAAAHAAIGLGADVKIIAPKQKTPQRGPLLIQRPIPGINTNHPDGTIHQVVVGGSILDYRYKLYGDINVNINGDILQPQYHAWDHRATYDILWNMYHHLIDSHVLSISDFKDLERLKAAGTIDLIVSTANSLTMCYQQHSFETILVTITPIAVYPDQPDNTIIFNAYPEDKWVRSSRIFGNEVTEWPASGIDWRIVEGYGIERKDIRVIRKPISTNCNCYPLILRTGRFGAWKNETWVDTAYYDTRNALVNMSRKDELGKIK